MLAMAGVIGLAGTTLFAQDMQYNSQYANSQYNRPYDQPRSEELFSANELQLDLFGTYSAPQNTIEHLSGDRLEHTGRAGAGIGVNYFFLRWLGVGADAYTENTAGSWVDNVSGNLILRLPLDSVHLAPYVYGGGGRQFDPRQTYFGQVGLGVEVRIIKHVGLFVDGRYVMTVDSSPNFAVARGGIRISF